MVAYLQTLTKIVTVVLRVEVSFCDVHQQITQQIKGFGCLWGNCGC